MSVVMFTNLKGGVAKTTNAVAVAECLASRGHRTLMIDADHQCTASELLLGETEMMRADKRCRTLHDLLKEMLDPEFTSAQLPTFVVENASNINGGLETLSIIPCSIRIDDFQTNYAKGKGGFKTNDEFIQMFKRNKNRLRSWLRKTFDYVIVDCPPSMALQVQQLLTVTDAYIVPCQPNKLSYRGAGWLRERIRRTGQKKVALGTLWSMVRGADRKHAEIIEAAKSKTGEFEFIPTGFKTQIPLTVSISHATEECENLQPATFRAKYDPKFAALYEKLCDEIISRLNSLENFLSEK